MSRMRSKSPSRRPRRHFSDQYKAGAVRLVIDEGKTVGAVARDLDLTRRPCAARSSGRARIEAVARPA